MMAVASAEYCRDYHVSSLFWGFRINSFFYRCFGISYIVDTQSIHSVKNSIRRSWYVLLLYLFICTCIAAFSAIVFTRGIYFKSKADDSEAYVAMLSSLYVFGNVVHVINLVVANGFFSLVCIKRFLEHLRACDKLEHEVEFDRKSHLILKTASVASLLVQIAMLLERVSLVIFSKSDIYIWNTSFDNATHSTVLRIFGILGYIASTPVLVSNELWLVFISVFFSLCLRRIKDRLQEVTRDAGIVQVKELKRMQKLYLKTASCVDQMNEGIATGVFFIYLSSFIFACFTGVLTILHPRNDLKVFFLRSFVGSLCQIIFPTLAVGCTTTQVGENEFILSLE